jgi:uncharacterized protein
LEIFAGLIIGLLGSMHCIGMCGPVVFALPAGYLKSKKFILGRVVYNLGRVITYSIFGLIFGLIGKGFFLAGIQQWVSIAMGVLILLIVFIPGKLKQKFLNLGFLQKIIIKFKSLFGKYLSSQSFGSMLVLGILNGLLPCGLVYVAVAGAVALGDIFSGVIFMALFGLGTIPAMLGFSLLSGVFFQKIKTKINRLIPVFAAILALIFILRGLNLGIPYLSPKLNTQTEKPCCH